MSRAESTIASASGSLAASSASRMLSRLASTSARVIDHMDGAALGVLVGGFVDAQHVVLQQVVGLGRLLGSRRQIHVAALVFSHSCYFHSNVYWVMGAVAEDPGDEPAEAVVEPVDQRHHDDDEDEHHTRVAEQFTPGRRDDLLQLVDDLSKKECDPREGSAPLGALPLGARDEVLTGILDHLACHSQHLSTGNAAICCGVSQGGQDLNLQPAVLETAALPIEPPPYRAQRRPATRPAESGHDKAWQTSPLRFSVRHPRHPPKWGPAATNPPAS